MTPTFSYQYLSSLPVNGWSAIIRKQEDLIRVFHGGGVESRDQFFAEAVWNDRFDVEGMGKATLFFGTGCMIRGTEVVFMTSSDQSAPLYSLQRKEEIIVSNSIIHLMTLAGTTPLRAYPFYSHDFVRNSRAGIAQPAGTLFHSGRGSLKVHFNTRISVSIRLIMGFSPYLTVPEPVNYESLLSIYRTEIGRLFENGADKGRGFKYGQTVLCSSGYDSLANAVVCAGLGSRRFISVVNSRSDSPEDDSGKVPLGFLGHEVREVDRCVHLTNSTSCDAEFALTALSTYPFLSGCEEDLGRSLLVNGSLGDVIWSVNHHRLAGDDWTDWGLHLLPFVSSTEHRLRVGYIDMGPQSMFVRHARALFRIASSEEMEVFRMNSGYDRPIPRRIIEEAGIPRSAFATRKMMTASLGFFYSMNMHPDARESYHSFVFKSNPTGIFRWFSKGLFSMELFLYKHWFKKHQQFRNDHPDRMRLVALDGPRDHVPWEQSFLFQWSFDMLKGRYSEPPLFARRKMM
jgi:hypothetical protein